MKFMQLEIHIQPNESTEHLVKRMEALALICNQEFITYGRFKIRYLSKFGFEYIKVIEGGLNYTRERQGFIDLIDQFYGSTYITR